MRWIELRRHQGLSAAATDRGPRLVTRTELLIAIGVSAVAWTVGSDLVVMRPLEWLVTLVHESGHAIAATVLGDQVQTVTINPHGGGLMYSTGRRSTFDTVIIGSAGYVGAALVGALMLELSGRMRRGRAAALLVAAIVTIIGLLWVPWSFDPDGLAAYATRSSSGDGRFTISFCVATAVLFVALALQPFVRPRRIMLVAIATVLCIASVESLKQVLDISSHGGHSDAENVAAVTPMSSWMWSAVWLAFGSVVCALGTWSAVFREDRKTTSPRA